MPRYNWENVAVNEWSVELDDLATILDHLAFASKTMQWFQNEGGEMLTREGDITYQEYESLIEKGSTSCATSRGLVPFKPFSSE